MRELGDRVRRARRDDRNIVLVRETDVENLARPVPEGHVGGSTRQRREVSGPTNRVAESVRTAVDVHPGIGQQPRHEGGLVRGDATGDTEQHPATVWLGHVSRPR